MLERGQKFDSTDGHSLDLNDFSSPSTFSLQTHEPKKDRREEKKLPPTEEMERKKK